MHGFPRPAVIILAFGLIAADLGSARAQRVSGTVREARTGAPVAGAFVTLVAPADSAVSREVSGLTGRAGRYSLLAPGPGRYRLQVERIGYRSTVTAAFDVAAGDAMRIDVDVPGEAIDLGSIAVEGRGRCVLHSEEGQPTWELWSEARKALEVTRWTEAGRSLAFRVVYFRRTLDPGTLVVESETVEQQLVMSERAFFAEPPDALARDGYIREADGLRSFYGPDATVLLSDAFLDTHCFRRVSPAGRGRIGLAFEPIDDDARRDVRGTLWLDAATGELRSLDFQYVNPDLPAKIEPDRYGGHVDFHRLPDGAWVVSRWRIRMPLFGRGRWILGGRSVTRVEEIEAEIAAVMSAAGERLPFRRKPTVLEGTVAHPTTGRPLVDAEVILAGTPFTARTDASGAFRFDLVSGSRYEVTFSHPDVRRPGSTVVELVRGDTLRVRLDG